MRYLAILFLLAFSFNCYGQNCFVRVEEKSIFPKEEGCTRCTGSGFFVDDNLILTCYHIIDNCIGEDPARVRIEYKNRIYLAKVLKYNKDHDLALLSVEVENEKIYSLAEEEPSKDELVTIKGYPAAKWDLFKNEGKVEALWATTHGSGGPFKANIIILQCMAIPGMSGGPFLNSDGKVCGILTGKSLEEPHRTFGTSITHIRELLEK